jgi:hypothetical protein
LSGVGNCDPIVDPNRVIPHPNCCSRLRKVEMSGCICNLEKSDNIAMRRIGLACCARAATGT